MYSQIKSWAKKNPKIKNLYRKLVRADIVEQKFMDLESKVIYEYIYNLENRVKQLEDKLGQTNTSSIALLNYEGHSPSLDNVVSQCATYDQVTSGLFKEWCNRLLLPAYPNRKTWEFIYICEALKQNGFIQKGMKGVGFGVGKDPIVSYFVQEGMTILATDLFFDAAKENGWVDTNQYSKNILNLNERGLVSDKQILDNVKFEEVDMNDIPKGIENYDFCWSACAFEHLGSIERGLDFVVNSLDCVRPGGIVVHTTEFNVSSNDETVDNEGTVLFRRKDIEKLAERVRSLGHEIKLNFNTGGSNFDRTYDVPPYSDYTHLKLKIDKFVSTSIGIIIKKKI